MMLDRYLNQLAQQSRSPWVVASQDGLLVAGAGANVDTLETLAAYAPSQLPMRAERPAALTSRRLELAGERLYVASVGAQPDGEVTESVASLLNHF